jgi:hypothetical protein
MTSGQEVVVRFVGVGSIIDQHCLHFVVFLLQTICLSVFFSQISYNRNMYAYVVVLTKSYLKARVEQAVLDVKSSSIHKAEGQTYTIGHNLK